MSLLSQFRQELTPPKFRQRTETNAASNLLDEFRREIAAYRDPNQLPGLTIFTASPQGTETPANKNNETHARIASLITETYSAFNVPVEVITSEVGPRVTQYYLRPQSINGKRARIGAIKALNEDVGLALDASVVIRSRPGKLILEIQNDSLPMMLPTPTLSNSSF